MANGSEVIRQRRVVEGEIEYDSRFAISHTTQRYNVEERAVGVTRKSEWETIAANISHKDALALLRFADG